MIRRYGWVRDLPDHRDLRLPPFAAQRRLPAAVEIRPAISFLPFNQGELGSCTGNAWSAAFAFGLWKQQARLFSPSRLFIYYNERSIERTIGSDSGAQLRNGLKSLLKQGVCPEDEWPYYASKFAAKPSPKCYKHALDHQIKEYLRVVQARDSIMDCLADGHPVVFGFSVYESFESDRVAHTGNASMPKRNEADLGGHAAMIVGYNNRGTEWAHIAGRTWPDRTFLILNSWGRKWGIEGCFTLPFDYVLDPDLASDFWSLRLVEAN